MPEIRQLAAFGYEVTRLRTRLVVTVKNLLDSTFIIDRTRGILPVSPWLIHCGATVRF